MLAWTEQVKCRELSEQPNYTRVATKPCNMKLVIGITLISVNHNRSTALEKDLSFIFIFNCSRFLAYRRKFDRNSWIIRINSNLERRETTTHIGCVR